MAQPPASPQSSDTDGVHRDERKIIARREVSDPRQGEQLAALEDENVARPPYDPEIASKGNSR